MKEELDK